MGSRTSTRIGDDGWGKLNWFQESPKEEKEGFGFGDGPGGDRKTTSSRSGSVEISGTKSGSAGGGLKAMLGALAETEEEKVGLKDGKEVEVNREMKEIEKGEDLQKGKGKGKVEETQGGPSSQRVSQEEKPPPGTSTPKKSQSILSRGASFSKSAAPRWNRLRSLLPALAHRPSVPPSSVAPSSANITDELITGGLAPLLLGLWFERDDKDHRRIPLLMHRLRIRVSDSMHVMHPSKSVFRIECEYAGVRWVVYRQMKDFVGLHTHYKLGNFFGRNDDILPEFPLTSIKYFNFLREKEEREVSKTEFARLQREALENYLIGLVRAVMFHPTANRLSAFLEISALSISLAQSGGFQYKAGYLNIEASGNKGGGFGRKGKRGWKEARDGRWCAVRESYLVVVTDPGEVDVWDVFLLDSDFKIERPKRVYRQGLNLLHGEGEDNDETSRARSVMLDPSTNTDPLAGENHADWETRESWDEDRKGKGKGKDSDKKKSSGEVSKHTFYIENSQMRLKLFARNERQMLQWIAALEKVASSSHFTGSNRFDSFAPIRLNVAAQWLVDGRDYFWNLSRAILLAKDCIYIHDWWLSPELQLRRPGMDKYRLDRLLERKAKEGVKIFIILYQEVSSRTTPTDSNYSKQKLVNLHPNIMVQRSPSHFQTGTFYWAHHEKLCVIDQAIAFMGGIDLCFGRWDTPQHVVIDDPEEGAEIWPGKDYSNARISDFHTLNKPDEDMYDRSRVPRMPWHDVGLQVVGQPARDLCRHFVQRWNWLLRIKNHSRAMPFLLPAPEFRPGELSQMGLTGTLEFQICRSAGPWSLGTPTKIERSIQNAYLKAIQLSEHFVYIENQFFVTSTTVNDVKIENKIGDAIVHRIIRAHREGTPWRCCIVVPVLPGFPFPIDHSDASALRIILECQNRTVFRGPDSIFARIRKEGISPDDHISVFSLRNWGKLRGDILTTEMVYIHGKVCIVDDRVVIIGSANINERSQRGDRDSEIAAIIRDTDLIDSTMAGAPFKVGRFAHTLRIRLMREHLGVDVDAMDEEDLMAREPVKPQDQQEEWDPESQQEHGQEEITSHLSKPVGGTLIRDTVGGIQQAARGAEEGYSQTAARVLRKVGLRTKALDAQPADAALREERTTFTREGEGEIGFTSAIVPTLEEHTLEESRPRKEHVNDTPIKEQLSENFGRREENGGPPEARVGNGELFGAPAEASTHPTTDDQPPHHGSDKADADPEEQEAPTARSVLRQHLNAKLGSKWTIPTPRPDVDPLGFEDPICDEFWKDVWVASAVHNTEIYRKVFHAVPDDLVTTWKQYKEFTAHHERMNKPVCPRESPEHPAVARVPSESKDSDALDHDRHGVPENNTNGTPGVENGTANDQSHSTQGSENQATSTSPPNANANGSGQPDQDAKNRKPAKGDEPFEKWEREEMEKLLGELNGHLVIYSTRFLEGEDMANNFLFNADRQVDVLSAVSFPR
ncbi:hypothetical protein JAAARDRAFT_171033 [Jaapia argillacea MUCL 33604]|uniref:Phospholipase n=1 Tax=Jaapia argillacea MUCL 33604 TaxID=933084 RepID=A0A067QIX0_9AGAM|nr:hypothetical protein JAAARDRAFT_171033 [Jaapia argillacea MUCL 33604]